jgi:hypothetical protein
LIASFDAIRNLNPYVCIDDPASVGDTAGEYANMFVSALKIRLLDRGPVVTIGLPDIAVARMLRPAQHDPLARSSWNVFSARGALYFVSVEASFDFNFSLADVAVPERSHVETEGGLFLADDE